MNKADLIMHPIRLRILMTLSGRNLTTREIARFLPDISQASIYRHIQLLLKGGVLFVEREVPVRGLVERVYAYQEEDALLSKEEIVTATGDDYYRYFHAFMETMMSQYRLYIQNASITPRQDGVAHWGEAIYLTPQEREEMFVELRDATLKRINNPATPDRTRYIVSRIIIPDKTSTISEETNSKDPDSKEPDSKEPDSKEPDSKEPDSKEPDSKEPDSKEPDSKEAIIKEGML